MDQTLFAYGLLGLLAIALVTVIVTDLRYRKIYNKLVLTVAGLAPLYWLARGEAVWPGFAIHIGIAAFVFLIFLPFYAFRLKGQRLMAAGDLKLLTAIGLWFPLKDMFQLLWYVALVGVGVTIAAALWHVLGKKAGRARVPYGVSIALGAIVLIGERYFNHFA